MPPKKSQPASIKPKRITKSTRKANGEQTEATITKTRQSSKKLLCGGTQVVESKSQAAEAEHQSVALEFFHLFEKLPTEVRIKIWHLAGLEQRFIGLKFDENRFKLPATLLVNKESNYETQKHFWDIRLPKWSIMANSTFDILLLDKSAFPQGPEGKFDYHITALHSLYCGTEFDVKELKPFTRIAITMAEIYHIWRTECIHCWMLANLLRYLPNTTELNVLMRLGDTGTKPEHMWILSEDDKKTQIDCFTSFISDFEYSWGRVTRANKKFKKITLKFVRMEHWLR